MTSPRHRRPAKGLTADKGPTADKRKTADRRAAPDSTTSYYDHVAPTGAGNHGTAKQHAAAQQHVTAPQQAVHNHKRPETPNERQLEALRTAEAQRAVFESLLDERESAIEAAEQRCAWLADELENLPELDAHILKLQREVGQTTADLAARAAHIEDLEVRLAEQRVHSNVLETQLAQQQSRISEISHQPIAGISAASRSETLHALEDSNSATLAELAAARMREAQGMEEIEALRKELAASNDAADLRIAEYEARLEARGEDSRVDALNADIAAQRELLQTMQKQAAESAERVEALNRHLRNAEEQMRTYQADLRLKDSRMDELLRSIGALQGQFANAARTLEQRDLGLLNLVGRPDSAKPALGSLQQRIQRARRDNMSASRDAHENAAAPVAHMLVRSEGGNEVVHMLGRKNRIGRTPDNDIQIDAKSVSRYHAVILTSPRSTIVEDLNSTNGVVINGRRVNRGVLADGDVVKIGKTKFRFVSKPADEIPARAQG